MSEPITADSSSHAPPGYVCPFCVVVAGADNPAPHSCQADVILRTEHVTAFVNARWWSNNPGHVLVVPNQHVENIYGLLPDLAVHVHEAARQVALAERLRAYFAALRA